MLRANRRGMLTMTIERVGVVGAGQMGNGIAHVFARAGYEVLMGGLAAVDVPVLVMGGSLDDATTMSEQVGPIYDGLRTSPRMLGSLTNAGHFLFSNACDLVGGENEECQGDYLKSEVGHPEVAATTTAFLRWVLGEEEMGECEAERKNGREEEKERGREIEGEREMLRGEEGR